MRNNFLTAYDNARRNINTNIKHYKRQYDKRAEERSLPTNTWVWLHNFARIKGRCPKLQHQWEDVPYRIIDRLSDVVVEIQRFGSKKERRAL